MKFFKLTFILKSYFRNLYLNHPYDVPNIPEPFLRLLRLYSMHHNLSTRNVYPNMCSSNEETPVAIFENSSPLNALQYHLHLFLLGTQYAYERGLYLLHPSRFLYPRCYKLGLSNPDNAFVLHLPTLYIDIWCTKLCEHLIDLLYDYQSYFPLIKNRKIFRNYKSCTKVHSFD